MNRDQTMAFLAMSSILFSGDASAEYYRVGSNQPSQFAQYQNPPSQYQGQQAPSSQYQYQPQPQQQPPQQPQYQGSYGPPPAYYPSYPAYPGGYLPPGPVDPGQDEANEIYRQNQHQPR